jgi:thiamine kinase-like enzyme
MANSHCDWSPTNILLDNQQLKLIDFDNISRKTFTNKDDAIRAIKQSLRGISEDKY